MKTNTTFRPALLLMGALLALGAAQAQAAKPHGTALCKDGSQSTAMQRKEACTDNGGVKHWYGKSTLPAAASAPAPTAASGTAVQTESAKVSATGQAPQTGNASKTPAKPDPMAK